MQSAMFVLVPFVVLLSGVAIETATVKQKMPFEVRLPTETGAKILRKELDFEVRLRKLERRAPTRENIQFGSTCKMFIQYMKSI